MQAFADGKKIESTIKGGDGWSVNKNPDWNWDRFDYRISPNQDENKEKKYRPYTMEEFVEEMHKHDGFIRHLKTNNYGMIISLVAKDCVNLGDYGFEYAELCNTYIWSDNCQPCGKEVAE